ncbi:MAG: DUF4097 family beta strand repeat protein [Clostridiales bacterium]|nr:DUF4097 family beta strand repeat protein [Clostridiales bacterium]
MKTFTKVALIIAGVSLSAGIALTVIGTVANGNKPIHMYYDHGFHIDSEGKVVEMKKTVVDDFKNINIDVPASEITFIESDEYAVEYKLQAKEVVCESEDDTLTIDTKSFHFDINFSWFNFDHDDYYVKVYYPKGVDFSDVMVDLSAGDVKIEDGFDCDKITLDMSAGDAVINNVRGELVLKMSAGDFTANNCDFGYSDFKLSAGDIVLNNCTINGGKLHMSAGDFGARALNLTDSFSIDMSAGSADIEFVPGLSIGYDFDLSAGSAKINGEKKGDEYQQIKGYDIILKAEMSAGSLNVTNE